jgi:Undecaprenyl-phosphate glucose phosphotransferase
MVAVCDFVGLFVGLVLAAQATYLVNVPLSAATVCWSFISSVVIILLFNQNNLYNIEIFNSMPRTVRRLAVSWGLATVAAFAIFRLFLRPSGNGLVEVIIYYLAGLAVLAAGRSILVSLFRIGVRLKLIGRDIVVAGEETLVHRLAEYFETQRCGVHVRATVTDLERNHDCRMRLAPHAVDALASQVASRPIDSVIIALPEYDSEHMAQIVGRLHAYPVSIRSLPASGSLTMPRRWLAPAGELPGLPLAMIADKPLADGEALLKAVHDRLLATLALILFGPVMLCCIVGIKLSDPGPVLFRQQRIGYRDRVFEVYKFRSMYLHSCGHEKLTERDDPRIFAFGRIMRKLSLDELPQIFNVLRGDMSLVGPRPHMPQARAGGQLYFHVVDSYSARHRVKPGITGWAQVNGWRGPTETAAHIKNRVSHDMHYIENWSLLLDYKILIRTALIGFFGKNAF